ncbi:hypothetical protein LG314_09140 [Agrococcus terreus]|uniref:hypothetical protein n=1 Tax=Agrococcus terreus TaxID=574649 RepID=UPI00384E42EA
MSSSSAGDCTGAASTLLDQIRRRYLRSRDFNGLHIYGDSVEASREPAIELIEAGLVQAVTGADYMNIHIRPWPSLRTLGDQVQDLRQLDKSDYGVCLYPTSAGMKGVRLPARLSGRPYARAMARGRGTLELAFFEFDVLEQYRNDSRFRFSFGDAGASMGLTDEAFDDQAVFERDHVGLNHIGFAYDLRGYDLEDLDSPVVRRVAVFYCDLVSLTPEHQRRWETFQVAEAGLQPHPLWWGSQMGVWPDGVGPFDRLFMELANLNELSLLAFDESMFRTTQRPPELGWLLRPSQREWDAFTLELDKVLSENLRSQFFDAAEIAREGPDGRRIGTLTRLHYFLKSGGVEEQRARETLEPLRRVRKERQGPAHAVRTNITDRSFIHRQVALLRELNLAIRSLRDWLSTHPACKGWTDESRELQTYWL